MRIHYTSIEQSKRLLELGLNPESADMLYTWDTDNKTYYPLPIIDDKEHDFPSGLSCWSVGALLEVMPKWDDYSPYIGKNECFYSNDDNEIYHREVGTSIESAYEMIVWLLENNYIKKV